MELQALGYLGTGGNTAIEISQRTTHHSNSTVKALLQQVEAELVKSEVYGRALASLKTMLGEAAVGAEILMKAVGREAIRLAVKGIAKKKKSQGKTPPTSENSPVISESSQVVVKGMSDLGTMENKNPCNSLDASTNEPTNIISPDQSFVPIKLSLPLHLSPKPKPLTAEEKAKILLKERREKLEKICEELKKSRQQRGLSLYQLHRQTLIPLHHLEALEKGQLDRLPEAIYLRGFIYRIAQALGLDSGKILENFPAPDINSNQLPSWCIPRIETNTSYIRPIHLYLGYTALVAGVIGGVGWLSQEAHPTVKEIPSTDPLNPSAISPDKKDSKPVSKPGLKSSQNGQIILSSAFAPPEIMGG